MVHHYYFKYSAKFLRELYEELSSEELERLRKVLKKMENDKQTKETLMKVYKTERQEWTKFAMLTPL